VVVVIVWIPVVVVTTTEVWPFGSTVVNDVVNTPEVTMVVETSMVVSFPLAFPTFPLWMRFGGAVKGDSL